MYSRQKAVEYAYMWWDKRNPKFYNFDDLGGDCTNFVSQCLFFGGIEMNMSANGWFYNNLSSRSPSWTGVEQFFSFAISNQKNLGVRAELSNIQQIEIGDVVQLKLRGENRFHHSLLITHISGVKNYSNVLLTSHTYDALNKPIDHYFVEDIRFLKILNA